jgi:hypothetical protein
MLRERYSESGGQITATHSLFGWLVLMAGAGSF